MPAHDLMPLSRPRRRVLPTAIGVVALAGLGALVVWGFSLGRGEAAMEKARERPVEAASRVSRIAGAEPVVTLDAAARRQSGIALGAPQPAHYQQQVRGYGAVLDLDKLVALHTSFVTAGAQLQTARARLVASKAAFERAGTLYRDRTAPLADVQTSEANFRADQAGLTTAEVQLRTLRATALQEWGPVIGRAVVESGPLIDQLIERQAFLVQVTLPPGTTIAPPPTATVQFGASAAHPTVRFVSVATQMDPRIQGMSFYYLADAESHLLPGMNLLAFLSAGDALGGFEIPASAVVWWNGRAWVYAATGPDTFARRAIPIGASTPAGGFAVPAGTFPQPPPEIVTQGAQSLLSEEFRTQVQVGEDSK